MEIKKIAKLSPYISSENIGDFIIDEYCNEILTGIFPGSYFVDIPTRDRLSKVSREHLSTSDYSFVCGTNILSSNMKENKQWNMTIHDALLQINDNVSKKEYICNVKNALKKAKANQVILMGVGWWQYQAEPDEYTKILLRILLSGSFIHSVRDSYTEKKLKDMGISNVLNTSCPTMWGLSADVCEKIPCRKAKQVVTTLTNYHKEKELDKAFLELLLSEYEEVNVWLQSLHDMSYLEELGMDKYVSIIPPTLSAFDSLLRDVTLDVEYVGTRLHGGIRALNKMRRCLIIAVDNRALEIAKDTGLPVIARNDIDEKLLSFLQNERATKIKLPINNIEKWKSQFVN